MRKHSCLNAFVTLVAAFAFAGTANATHKGAEHGGGKKPHAAFNAFVADAVPCADSVAIVPAGSIEVGLDVPQCYTYDMVIEDAELGSVHRDELTANWDLDGASEAAVDDASGIGGNPLAEDNSNSGFTGSTATDEEDFSNDGSINGVCGDGICDGALDSECTDGLCDGFVTDGICPDGECDGVDLTGGCTDGTCDGLSVTATNVTCSVFASQPDSAVKTNSGNIPAKQPEIIIVTIDSVSDADNECRVQVSARTVLNPGGSDPTGGGDPDLFDDCGAGDLCAYEPRKCKPLREHTRLDSDGDGEADTDELAGIICTDGNDCLSGGVPFVNFETLNLGIKSFAADGSIIVGAGDFVTSKISVELEPLGCDTDGGGQTDVDEAGAGCDPLDPTDDFCGI